MALQAQPRARRAHAGRSGRHRRRPRHRQLAPLAHADRGLRLISLWRIAAETAAYRADDLSGKGAELSGGRWNRPGMALVYASTSRALACLETVVHLDEPGLPLNRYLIEIRVPVEAWRAAITADPARLVGWDALPEGVTSLDWGDAWARAGRSLIARVPSVVVPEEENVLVNPRHPQAARLSARKVRKWPYDTRLAATSAPA